ncbi:histidinol dehydrogenase [Aridibaculum aurantiacum]|uniref:histidinol dehydrogenase n=1 Tax=Aridibaculum aurantiacum TaxID=2810307 RepID=UPI001A97121A|nr:histidinol dehydrogenase [Aridibaculum aurantiacum]
MLTIYNNPPKAEWPNLLQRPTMDTAALEANVTGILESVKANGDLALRNFALKFDKVTVDELAVSQQEIIEAEKLVSDDLKAAIKQAAENIEKFHGQQLVQEEVVETMPGVQCWRKSVGIEKVGLYIPGGTAPLFSTILMLAIPAAIAGCKEVLLCSPPNAEGKLHPAILYTASLVGVSKIFKTGGAQAIAAMAYGTESIPQVYKIFGPGNQYVTCAKQLVQKDGVAIDMPAGPSEVAVLADETADPIFVAADLLSQAEHGADSQVLLVTTSETVASSVSAEVELQLEQLPRKDFAAQSLAKSKVIVVGDLKEAVELLNQYAAEHLIINCENADAIAEQVVNAGSVFIGNYSPESVGDYASGTNHTLPTNGYAKAYSGVSVDSFVKKITFQKLTKAGLENIGQAVQLMAAAEGLEAHANAVSKRLDMRVENLM